MRPSPELERWLADPGKHQAVADRWDAYTLAMGRHPLIAGLKADLAALENPTPPAVLTVAESFLDRTAMIEALIEDLIAAAAADPFLRLPFLEVRTDVNFGLLLFENPLLQISIGVISVDALAAKRSGRRGGASISFTGHTTAYQFVKGGGATLSLWEAPAVAAGFRRDPGVRCRPAGTRHVRDGDRLILDGRRQSFAIEHASSDIVHIQAAVRTGTAPFAVEYDAATLRLIGASSTDEAASRLQMMVSMLRILDRADAAPLIAEALASPHFHIRWHVMRELLALDADLAHPHLLRMAVADPHPEVRAAARQTLEAFFAPGDEPCPA